MKYLDTILIHFALVTGSIATGGIIANLVCQLLGY
jgi:hypothetical protein